MLTSRGAAIPLDSLSESKIKELKQELTVKPEVDSKYQTVAESYKIFMMSAKYIYIPRHFIPHDFLTITKKYKDIVSTDIRFDGVLKSSTNQPEAVAAVLEGFRTQGSGLLSLPTGYGKTTVALYVMCELKYKTLIVVHKEFLMTQWLERIVQFVPGARVGRIQGNVIDVKDKDIVIGMLQSLSMKEYDKTVFDGFGLTIIDETHHVCTRTFSKMLMKINTPHMLGLSATLQRKDGLTKVIHWFLGAVLFEVKRKSQRQVVVECIDFKCNEYHQNTFPLNRARQPNVPEAISYVTNIPSRNQMIFDVISAKLLENRHILVLTDRRQHCIDLDAYYKLSEPEVSTGLYMGGMKPCDLKKSEECSVIFATFSLAYEGLDIPVLDTLILATPKSDIVQSVGRILRETDGKKNNPCVVDIIDNWGPFQYQYYKRLKYYKDTGFKINKAKNPTMDEEECRSYSFVEEF